VWAEPSAVEAAAFEFSQTEEFLVAAESLTCPYAWGRYDILCLPPSFPYGGMENPCLTFATPTLLAGGLNNPPHPALLLTFLFLIPDKSLADVIAHEIAHSWTGNLVTNCTWEHFWLNEGWTVWLERKIMSRYTQRLFRLCFAHSPLLLPSSHSVKGDRDVLKLSAEIGWKALKDSVALMGNGKFTELVWPLQVEDPDDAFSSVPYEKVFIDDCLILLFSFSTPQGFNFLFQLESIVGTGPFEEFAKNYINAHKFGCVSSGEFKDYFLGFFGGNPEVAALDWDQFFYSTGSTSSPPI
jgi:leukotriene-A4 hydrolase